MQYTPKQRKFEKYFKGRLLNNSPKALQLNEVYADSVFLIAKQSGRITPSHIGCLNITLKRVLKKSGLMTPIIFPHTPITSKPLEVRMGKGKGSTSYWAGNVFSGDSVVKVHVSKLKKDLLLNTLKNLKKKLPVKTKLMFK